MALSPGENSLLVSCGILVTPAPGSLIFACEVLGASWEVVIDGLGAGMRWQ